MDIRVELTKAPKEKPQDETKLGFGHIFTDHMFVMNYDTGEGWHDARIVPYGDITLSPAAMCLHYGQEIFEGLKAYRRADGHIQLFRPDENYKRLNNSAKRMVIPEIDGHRPLCRRSSGRSLHLPHHPFALRSLLFHRP